MNNQFISSPKKGVLTIPSNRLHGFDYGSHALYFVTICTKDRIHYFGEIHDSSVETGNCPSLPQHNGKHLHPTTIGKIAFGFWMEIPIHYPFVILEEFVVMPNHIHGILFFNKPHKTNWTPNSFGIQSQNLGAVIRAYKSSVKRYANQHEIGFHWQSRYHDHIIRNDKEHNAIKNYIINNPKNWNDDKLNDITHV